jgi:hypothetical protein
MLPGAAYAETSEVAVDAAGRARGVTVVTDDIPIEPY